MSSYENPEVDHSVNTSQRSALGEFASLSLWLALGTVLVVAGLYLGARWVAPWVPFSWEVRMAEPLVRQLVDSPSETAPSSATSAPPRRLAEQRQAWLQGLANALKPALGMGEEMPITVHWSDSQVPNAFATLGGHVVINQGFLDRVNSENAVAMVMAHELAHVKHRDPIASLGGGLMVGMGMAALFGSGTLAGEVASALSQLHFSRKQERAADAAALAALQARYGHTQDAEAFFVRMLCEEALGQLPEFLNTHPDTAARVQAIAAGRPAATGQSPAATPQPLPAFMHDKRADTCKAK